MNKKFIGMSICILLILTIMPLTGATEIKKSNDIDEEFLFRPYHISADGKIWLEISILPSSKIAGRHPFSFIIYQKDTTVTITYNGETIEKNGGTYIILGFWGVYYYQVFPLLPPWNKDLKINGNAIYIGISS